MATGLPNDAVEVGRILGAWGIKGWIKVQAFSTDPQALFSSKRWLLMPPDAAAEIPGKAWPAELRIAQAREHGDGIVAEVRDQTDRNAAEALRGARIYIPRNSFPTADIDEFYWVDLIGLEVVNREAQALGAVVGLLDTGAHSVLRVQAAGSISADKGEAAERLIPFVSAYVDKVDLEGRCIVVDWGLDY